MAEYKSVINWSRYGAFFTDSRYSRGPREVLHRELVTTDVGCEPVVTFEAT